MRTASAVGAPRRTTAAARLAEFALSLRPDEIPAGVREAAKLHLGDALGCGLAALALGRGGEARLLAAAQAGAEQASVIGLPRLQPAAAAALANGALCHALDFDDTHAGAVAHVSTVVGPAALATAESAGARGDELLAAVVAANEIVTRVGMAAPGAFHARGFHPTAVCGVFGAAAAAARLLQLDHAAATSALGLAGSMASGLFAYLDDGTETKPVHAGFAAHAGILAAKLAALGAEGPPSVFEARFGFYRAFVGGDGDALAAQLDDLGERWETLQIAYKAYPACHYMHGVLGAAAEIASSRALDASRIARIDVAVPPGPAASLVLEPVAEKTAPRTPYEAKFSLQYSLASLLVRGRVGLDTYTTDAIEDAAVVALASRVRHTVRTLDGGDGAFPGAVRIVFDDGSEVEAELAHQPGAPENPLSPEQIEEKFLANATLALDAEAAAGLFAAIRQLEEQDIPNALAPLRAASRSDPDLQR